MKKKFLWLSIAMYCVSSLTGMKQTSEKVFKNKKLYKNVYSRFYSNAPKVMRDNGTSQNTAFHDRLIPSSQPLSSKNIPSKRKNIPSTGVPTYPKYLYESSSLMKPTSGFARSYFTKASQESEEQENEIPDNEPWWKKFWNKLFNRQAALGAGLIVGGSLGFDQLIENYTCDRRDTECIQIAGKRIFIRNGTTSGTLDGTNKKIQTVDLKREPGIWRNEIENVNISNIYDINVDDNLTIINSSFRNIYGFKLHGKVSDDEYSHYNYNQWQTCSFDKVSFTTQGYMDFKGDIKVLGKFNNCDIKNSYIISSLPIYMHCDNTTLNDIKINDNGDYAGSTTIYAAYKGCILKNIKIGGNYSKSYFKDSTFTDTTIENMECSKSKNAFLTFENCTFTNMDFKNSGLLNKENITFENCTFNNCSNRPDINEFSKKIESTFF